MEWRESARRAQEIREREYMEEQIRKEELILFNKWKNENNIDKLVEETKKRELTREETNLIRDLTEKEERKIASAKEKYSLCSDILDRILRQSVGIENDKLREKKTMELNHMVDIAEQFRSILREEKDKTVELSLEQRNKLMELLNYFLREEDLRNDRLS